MEITFSKMHGLGNDFVVIDGVSQTIVLDEVQRRLIADRHLGIGCDQILLLESCTDDTHDFVYRIFNADGSEAQQCGNGARCVTSFAHDRGLTNKNTLKLKTSTGSLISKLSANGEVRVDMGKPLFTAESLPFDSSFAEHINDNFYRHQITVSDTTIHFSIVSMGNPHAVIHVDNTDKAPVSEHGTLLGAHAAFPNGVNVGFMQIIAPDHIKLRVFERGAGETLACGTGACAAVATARRCDLVEDKVAVSLPGGKLQIEWSGNEGDPLFMSGPAKTVFNGKITL
ncbi:MAG: diaminopimelate epimerase [Gammaproteobacteria bacterium]|nr:diaminopimelate epimerase [Gammaproteobacteria bacterium]